MVLEILTQKYKQIQKLHNYTYRRYFFDKVDFNDKMVGILGSRGVGRTTFILQYLTQLDLSSNKSYTSLLIALLYPTTPCMK